MDISVVMPTLNKVDLLRKTLAALGGQTLPPELKWEVVVVNDGCTDGTAGFLEECRQSFPVPLHIVDPGRNLGRAKARNLGIQQASGRWVLFLDDDILVPSDLLAAHHKLLVTDERAGTIGYAKTDPSLIDAPHFYYLDSRGVAHSKGVYAPSRFFVTQNAAVPRWALLDVGGFAEDFSAYGFEDMELAFRLEDKCGLKFFALKTPVPFHIHHHTLQEYLAKKIECGRFSLPLLAQLHPQRLAEMRLDLAFDSPWGKTSFLDKLFRILLDSGLGSYLPNLTARWKVGDRKRPFMPRFYYLLMSLTVLQCFRRGIKSLESGQ